MNNNEEINNKDGQELKEEQDSQAFEPILDTVVEGAVYAKNVLIYFFQGKKGMGYDYLFNSLSEITIPGVTLKWVEDKGKDGADSLIKFSDTLFTHAPDTSDGLFFASPWDTISMKYTFKSVPIKQVPVQLDLVLGIDVICSTRRGYFSIKPSVSYDLTYRNFRYKGVFYNGLDLKPEFSLIGDTAKVEMGIFNHLRLTVDSFLDQLKKDAQNDFYKDKEHSLATVMKSKSF